MSYAPYLPLDFYMNSNNPFSPLSAHGVLNTLVLYFIIAGRPLPPIIEFTPAAFFSILGCAVVVLIAPILLICYILKNKGKRQL